MKPSGRIVTNTYSAVVGNQHLYFRNPIDRESALDCLTNKKETPGNLAQSNQVRPEDSEF
jgi:hypothetical protein